MSPEKTEQEILKFFHKKNVNDILSIRDVKELPISVQLPNQNEADKIFCKPNLEELSMVTKRSDIERDTSWGSKTNKGQVTPITT